MDSAENHAFSGTVTEKSFVFSSTVAAEMREAVEQLFFFNSRQAVLGQAIYTTIQRTGIPTLMENQDRIWIGVPSGALQCLFASVACQGRAGRTHVAGVALYGRPSPDVLSIVHLAVDSNYIAGNPKAGPGAGQLLIVKIQEIARRVQGVQRIQLPYRDQGFLRL